ncbi:MAG: hypothetical protein AAGA90_07995 [Actinomycetota bacterium]
MPQTAFSQNVATVILGVALVVDLIAIAYLAATAAVIPDVLGLTATGLLGALAGLAKNGET